MKPLLRMVRKHTVSDDIRDSLVRLVKHALQRDYITSHERYMEMAIGNAPWPIGVTNAGIHARPARENIFSKHVAHVLNDETQRKFIQGLKRLLTKAQQYYPTDPSRCVDYVKRDIKEKKLKNPESDTKKESVSIDKK
jgi:pre-mRNA-splicing factor 18